MRRIIPLLLLITLIGVLIFEVKRYYKFSSPNMYDYAVPSEKIDINYHDTKLVDEYFEIAYRIGSYAREVWYNEGLDVRFADASSTYSQNATTTYSRLNARLKQLEAKLLESKRLKTLGFDNSDIAFIEKYGISEKQYSSYKVLLGRRLKIGDENEAVWEMQKYLINKGLLIRLDGIFDEETKGAVVKFQKMNNLYPSGSADDELFKLLIQ